jgi:hypothetical protein
MLEDSAEPLQRQWAFTMREIICIGTEGRRALLSGPRRELVQEPTIPAKGRNIAEWGRGVILDNGRSRRPVGRGASTSGLSCRPRSTDTWACTIGVHPPVAGRLKIAINAPVAVLRRVFHRHMPASSTTKVIFHGGITEKDHVPAGR